MFNTYKGWFYMPNSEIKKMKITTLYFKANFTLQKFNNILLASRLIGGCLFFQFIRTSSN